MIKFVKFNPYRKTKYRILTVFKDNYFIKKAETHLAFDFVDSLIKKYKLVSKLDLSFKPVQPVRGKDGIKFKKIDGQSLRSMFEVRFRNKDEDYVIREIHQFIKELSKESNLYQHDKISKKDLNKMQEIFGKSLVHEQKWLKVGTIDLIFDNIIIDKAGNKYLVDYEWTWDFPIPVDFVIFRSVYTFLHYMKLRGFNISKLYKKFSYLFQDKFIRAEYNFLKYVSSEIYSYGKFKKNIFSNLKTKYHKIMFIQDSEKIIEDMKFVIRSKDKYIHDLNNIKKELEKTLKNVSEENVKLNEDNRYMRNMLSRRSVRIALKFASFLRKILIKVKLLK